MKHSALERWCPHGCTRRPMVWARHSREYWCPFCNTRIPDDLGTVGAKVESEQGEAGVDDRDLVSDSGSTGGGTCGEGSHVIGSTREHPEPSEMGRWEG
jgi:hypothetical protein